MDDRRFEVLKHKAQAEGLSEEEAAELGRLYAEEEGATYSSAADRETTAGDLRREAERVEAADHESKVQAELDLTRAFAPEFKPGNYVPGDDMTREDYE